METIARIKQEIEVCKSCQHTEEYCATDGLPCKLKEWRKINGITQDPSAMIQDSTGVEEIPIWKNGDGMSIFSQQVAGYTEPWMEHETWSIT